MKEYFSVLVQIFLCAFTIVLHGFHCCVVSHEIKKYNFYSGIHIERRQYSFFALNCTEFKS